MDPRQGSKAPANLFYYEKGSLPRGKHEVNQRVCDAPATSRRIVQCTKRAEFIVHCTIFR